MFPTLTTLEGEEEEGDTLKVVYVLLHVHVCALGSLLFPALALSPYSASDLTSWSQLHGLSMPPFNYLLFPVTTSSQCSCLPPPSFSYLLFLVPTSSQCSCLPPSSFNYLLFLLPTSSQCSCLPPSFFNYLLFLLTTSLQCKLPPSIILQLSAIPIAYIITMQLPPSIILQLSTVRTAYIITMQLPILQLSTFPTAYIIKMQLPLIGSTSSTEYITSECLLVIPNDPDIACPKQVAKFQYRREESESKSQGQTVIMQLENKVMTQDLLGRSPQLNCTYMSSKMTFTNTIHSKSL